MSTGPNVCFIYNDSPEDLEGPRQKADAPNIAVIALADDNVAVVIHAHAAAFADFRIGSIEEPPIAGMRTTASAVEKQMDDASGVQVPKLAAIMREQQVTASGHRPNTTHPPQTGVQRGKTIAAPSGKTVAGNHRLRSLWRDTIDKARPAIARNDIAIRLNNERSEFGESRSQSRYTAGRSPSPQPRVVAEVSQS